MTILALSMSRQHVGRDQFAVAVIAVGVVGLQDAQPVLDGDAGRDDQEAAAEQPAVGRRTALTVCQAISIAMTVVLPAAGRHLHGDAEQFGVGLLVGARRCSRNLS